MGLLILIGECNDACILSGVSVIKASSAELIDCPDAAVILGAGARVENIRAALSVIVNGDELSKDLPRGVQLITCGVSPKNTVSITSRTPEKITLSLNRSIRTKSGVIEPLELPVPLENALSEYEMMARFAAGLLLETP
ncbi:MAG: hypothetical protein K2J77_05285 [Oscillospiraceae bacterium]|nr:hypothetical protein [Oscillospiraceae bacterium]